MKERVVADTGVLIGLARVDRLTLIKRLFKSVIIPPLVFNEIMVSSNKPGAEALSRALESGWIKVVDLKKRHDSAILHLLTDSGEAEAIQLALDQKVSILLIDDKKGRIMAKNNKLRVIGTGGILLLAKNAGFIEEVAPVLNDLADAGYRLSSGLVKKIIDLANEG